MSECLYKKQLSAGLYALGLDLSEQQQQQLLAYLALLKKWNKTYNLTADTDMLTLISRHCLDSLVIARHIQGEKIIDVGTGAGLPGIPLAIVFPQKKITLLDSRAKKTRFLTQVKAELKLNNVEIVTARVESYQSTPPFDTVVSRAYAPLEKLYKTCSHLCVTNGIIMTLTSNCADKEIEIVEKLAAGVEVMPYQVPGEAKTKQLISIRLT